MSGNRFLLDTNAIVFLLKGDSRFIDISLDNSRIFISVISIVEFLIFGGLTEFEKAEFEQFCEEIEVVGFDYYSDNNLIEKTIEFRKKYKMKLPDAIIAASAQISQASLISGDKDFKQVSEINIISI